MKLIAKEPYKTKAQRTIEKVLKPARYKDVETGKSEIKKIVDENGQVEEKTFPITERVFLEALKEMHEIEIDVWIVETEFNGEVENHEFANPEDAERYYRGFE